MSKPLLMSFASALALVGGTAWAQGASQAPAADSAAAELGEIVVTAERRAQRLDRVPLSVSAISGAALEAQQIPRVQDLAAQVPGLAVVQNRLGAFKIAIRGIGGSAGDNIGSNLKVAVFLDDVYLARQGAMDPTFFNLDRIEVLRGPQGTLYGKNAVAGAINIHTRPPGDAFEMRAAVDVGNHDTINTRLLISGPLSDHLSGSLVVGENAHSGFGTNVATGREVSAGEAYFGRGTLRYRIGTWDLIASADYETNPDQGGRGFHIQGTGFRPLRQGPFFGPPGFHDIANDVDNVSRLELAGASIKATHAGADLTFTSITGHRWSDRRFQIDVDNTDSRITGFDFQDRQRQKSAAYSQEFRLSSTESGAATLGGRLFWNLGAYAFAENGSTVETVFLPTLVPRPQVLVTDLEAANFAVYGQGVYDLTDDLHLTAGLRYSWERKKALHSALGVPLLTDELYSRVPISETWQNLSPKLTLDYTITDDAMVYVTYARGFLSGAINSGPATAALAATEAADPEIDDNFEVGLKGNWFDGRLYAGLAGFYIKYKDLQVQVANQAGQSVTRNAARATSKGVEVEVRARPVDGLRLDFGYAYTDARYDVYCAGGRSGFLIGAACAAAGGVDNAGGRLEYYYPTVLRAGFEYTRPLQVGGELSVRGDWTHNSRSRFPGFYQTGYGLFNAGARYVTEDGRWSVAVFGRNLADEEYVTGCGNFGATANGGACSVGDPRTYGVTLTWTR